MPHRNTALAARYHYHTHLRRLAYEDALAALEEEFFITGTRIIDILTGAAFDEVERLAKQQPTAKELAARYPQWSW